MEKINIEMIATAVIKRHHTKRRYPSPANLPIAPLITPLKIDKEKEVEALNRFINSPEGIWLTKS